MKKQVKSKKRKIGIIAGIIGVLGIGGISLAVINGNAHAHEEEGKYQLMSVEKAAPLIFKGEVTAEKTQYFYLDQTLGKISGITVKDGQEVKADTVVLTYENATVQEQADEQSQALEKANLAVQAAQQNLDAAASHRNDISNQYQQALADSKKQNNTAEGQAKKQELVAKADALKQQLTAQQDAVLLAQQALDAANLDLSNTNESMEKAQGKIASSLTAGMDGIAYVDDKGKTDGTTPAVTVVSPTTVVEGEVSEFDYERLHQDQKVTIKPTNGDAELEGTILRVDKLPEKAASSGAMADQGGMSGTTTTNYSFIVKPSKNLQYGYSVQITLPLEELRIPESAIIKEGEERFVYVVESGKAQKKAVKITENDGLFIVTEGLAEKAVIVENPDDQLKDGQEVVGSK